MKERFLVVRYTTVMKHGQPVVPVVGARIPEGMAATEITYYSPGPGNFVVWSVDINVAQKFQTFAAAKQVMLEQSSAGILFGIKKVFVQ